MRWVGGNLTGKDYLVIYLIFSPQFFCYLEKNSPVQVNETSLPQSTQSIAEHLTLTPFFSLPSFWRQKALQEQGEIRVIQLGFDLDAHGIIFTEDYRARVRVTVCRGGRGWAGREVGERKSRKEPIPLPHISQRAQGSGK